MLEKLRSFSLDQSLVIKILGFFLLMIIFSTVIGVTNNSHMNRITNQLKSITQIYTPGLTQAAKLKSIVAREEAEALAVIMLQKNPPERWKHIQQFRQLNRSFTMEIEKMTHLTRDTMTKNKLNKLKEKHKDFAYIANTMFTRSLKNHYTVVNALFPNYQAVALEMQDMSDQFYTYYSQQVTTTEQQIFDQAQASQITSFCLVSIGIITGLLLMSLLGWIIRGPIQRLIEVTDILATGELRVRADASRKDELGFLACSVNQMAESMGMLLEDITQTVQHMTSSSHNLTVASHESSLSANALTEDILVLEKQAQEYTDKVKELVNVVSTINDEVQRVSKHTSSVQLLLEDFAKSARRGGENSVVAMEQMIITETKVNDMAKAIASFRKAAKEIVKITQVVSGFAKGTNLLALNASIEAAKAGEAGKGFAVVAKEIRTLANDSSLSVNEIAQLIGQIQTEAESAVGIINEGITALSENRRLVASMANDLSEMESSVTNIVDSMHQVNHSMSTIYQSATKFRQWINDIRNYADQTISHMVRARKKINEQMNVTTLVSNQAAAINRISEDLSAQVNKFKR